MAFDGAFLYQLKREIAQAAIGSRVEKIYQPSKEEIIILLRSRQWSGKLLISTRANSARLHFVQSNFENPAQPPMFCMLLRKKLSTARLVSVQQPGLERVLELGFEAVNELGDVASLKLTVEIMGRYSNIILVDGEGKIVDAIKRVDASMSGERQILPGMAYCCPPKQEKLDLLTADRAALVEAVCAFGASEGKNPPLDKALLGVLQGISPLISRELMLRTAGAYGEDKLYAGQLSSMQRQKLLLALAELAENLRGGGTPIMIYDRERKPKEFTFFPVKQYSGLADCVEMESYSALLEAFYGEKDSAERRKARSLDLLRLLTNAVEKLSKKINLQTAELEQCADREKMQIYGDLINANLYRLQKGTEEAAVENYYDPALSVVKIPMDPALTPAQNAQKYYKNYRRAQTAEKMLTEQIAAAKEELRYLETVFDALSRAESERDLSEIREELIEEGYLRKNGRRQKPQPMAQPIKHTTSGGFTVLVGRNNRENDRLTLKTAANNDIWFHTKNIPGSHTVLVTDGRCPSEADMTEAAILAARHSKAADSSQVPVDYTEIRHVHKPQGAKPGMVIYEAYHTIFVDPQKQEEK